MAILHHRSRSNANASLISILQRFSDILIIFLSLYLVCLLHKMTFNYQALMVALLVLVIFQMIGGITDFYRSWRGVKISAEILLILQNWTLSLILTMGVISFQSSLEIGINIFLQWYLIVS